MINIMIICGLVLLISITSTKILYKFGVPILLIFIMLGMLFGSDGIVGIYFNDYQLTNKIATVALIFIMFFIGIFGIDNKFKEIKVLNNFSCKNCNISNGASLVKYYTFFHFFFIPIFKWNEEYYVICNGCNSSFSIPKEKGKAIERGEDIEISYWDLKDNNINNNYLKKRCQKCNRELEKDFEYCPYCGEKIK